MPAAPQAVPLADLHPAPWNPRTISDERFQNLTRSVEADPAFLWLRPVLAMADGTIYAGNMRYRAVESLGWVTVPAIREDVPATVARERALRDNQQWGEWDDVALADLLRELEADAVDLSLLGFDDPGLTALLSDLAEPTAPEEDSDGNGDARYSSRIEPPVYRPTGPRPPVAELFDDSKTRALVQAVEAADGISDEERLFLTLAAQRHTVFHFGRIAEYYAHANAPLQAFMEDSALVIIDVHRAIELGFIQLTKALAEQVADEYPAE